MAVNKPEKSDKAEGGMKRRPAGSEIGRASCRERV